MVLTEAKVVELVEWDKYPEENRRDLVTHYFNFIRSQMRLPVPTPIYVFGVTRLYLDKSELRITLRRNARRLGTLRRDRKTLDPEDFNQKYSARSEDKFLSELSAAINTLVENYGLESFNPHSNAENAIGQTIQSLSRDAEQDLDWYTDLLPTLTEKARGFISYVGLSHVVGQVQAEPPEWYQKWRTDVGRLGCNSESLDPQSGGRRDIQSDPGRYFQGDF